MNEMRIFLSVIREFAILVAMLWFFDLACSWISAEGYWSYLGVGLLGVWVGAFVLLARRTGKHMMGIQGVGDWIRREFRVSKNFVFVLLLLSQTMACGYKYIEPGYVGVQVDKYGNQKGVQDFPVVTGVIWYLPWTTAVYEYPTFVQTAVWTQDEREGSPADEAIRYNSKEGLVFIADISLSYHLVSEKVPSFYVTFRSDDLLRFSHGLMHNLARDAFNELAPQYTSEQLYSEKKEILLSAAKARINEWVGQYGVVIDQFGYLGAPRPPDQIVVAINGKIQATQDAIRVQNEVAKSQAEAMKNVAIAEGAAKSQIARAEGEAKANELLAKSITPSLIDWRKLQITENAVNKWSGVMPNVMGQGGLLFNIPTEGK